MRYYLIVVGKGKTRRILTYCKVRPTAVQLLNHAIMDYGWTDARLVVTTIEPPVHLLHKLLEPAD